MLLFLTTNMAAVTSRANQQLEEPIVIVASIGLQGEVSKGEGMVGKGISGRSWDWDLSLMNHQNCSMVT